MIPIFHIFINRFIIISEIYLCHEGYFTTKNSEMQPRWLYIKENGLISYDFKYSLYFIGFCPVKLTETDLFEC